MRLSRWTLRADARGSQRAQHEGRRRKPQTRAELYTRPLRIASTHRPLRMASRKPRTPDLSRGITAGSASGGLALAIPLSFGVRGTHCKVKRRGLRARGMHAKTVAITFVKVCEGRTRRCSTSQVRAHVPTAQHAASNIRGISDWASYSPEWLRRTSLYDRVRYCSSAHHPQLARAALPQRQECPRGTSAPSIAPSRTSPHRACT